jgi:hypothetical protein
MKTLLLTLSILSATLTHSLAEDTDQAAKINIPPATVARPAWTGGTRNMELVSIGRKKVTILMADGRTAVIAVPILVERPIGSKLPTFKSK